jgi:hypothetical protein
MQDDTNMLDFLFIVRDLLVQIVRIGNVIKDEDVVLTILNVLPKSYEFFFVKHVSSKNSSKLWSIDIQVVIIGATKGVAWRSNQD